MSGILESKPRQSAAAWDRPQVIYMGLQKTGSAYLRGYFSAHPGIVWTREAGRLLTADGMDAYLDAARRACAVALAEKRAAGAAPSLWIDMQESLGLGYRVRPDRQWRADVMFSTDDRAAADTLDLSPPDFFTKIRSLCPESRALLTIRSQADWLFSNYHHFIHYLPARRREFPDFLATVEGKILAATAEYDRLVEKLHAAFGRDRVLVLPLESLERDAEGALHELSDFLGCAYVPFTPDDKAMNRGVDYRRGRGRKEIPVLVSAGGGGRVRRYARYALGLLGLRDIHRIPSKSALAREFGPGIAARYAPSNRRLAGLIGRDLSQLGYAV